MDNNLITAIVTTAGTVLVAIVAILSNNKRFDDLNNRMNDLNKRIDRVDTRLDHIEQMLATYVLDVARIKERLGFSS